MNTIMPSNIWGIKNSSKNRDHQIKTYLSYPVNETQLIVRNVNGRNNNNYTNQCHNDKHFYDYAKTQLKLKKCVQI